MKFVLIKHNNQKENASKDDGRPRGAGAVGSSSGCRLGVEALVALFISCSYGNNDQNRPQRKAVELPNLADLERLAKVYRCFPSPVTLRHFHIKKDFARKSS